MRGFRDLLCEYYVGIHHRFNWLSALCDMSRGLYDKAQAKSQVPELEERLEQARERLGTLLQERTKGGGWKMESPNW